MPAREEFLWVHNDRRDAEVDEYRKAEKAAAGEILQLLTANQARTWRDLVGASIELQSLPASELFILLRDCPIWG